MKIKAYLTIDDSPSPRMDDISDYLFAHNIQGLFFCCGDRLAENMPRAIHAIRKGQVLANHSYDHTRASQLSPENSIDQIARTEALIDEAYAQAGAKRGVRAFRFPHIDRGMGGWIMDIDALPEDQQAAARRALNEGLNQPVAPRPDAAALKKFQTIQDYLGAQGYSVPFHHVTPEWYNSAEIQAARDCFYTYSTCDWMVTARHRGKWPYQSLDDLKKRIDGEEAFQEAGSTHVILAHDQAEIVAETLVLIDHMRINGVEFLPIEK